MSDASKPHRAQGPIPVGELIQRLNQRQPGAAPEVRTRAPFPPVISEYGAVLTGRLKRHGAGSPPHRLGQYSYFVKVLTTDGLRTLWGSDLKRAIEESETRPKIDTLVGVQRVGYQILKLADGRQLRRNRWRVESIKYFAERARVARQARESRLRDRNTGPRPSAPRRVAINLERAQTFADRHIHSPHDRERFLDQVKNRLQLSALQIEPDRFSRDKEREPPTR